MTTIKQIANLAGVSRGTVDRVLNNRGGVNLETECKIREIAAMVNYTPNKAGKTLAIRKKNIKLGVALLNSKSSNPFINELNLGARKQARELEEFGVTVEFRQTHIGHPEQQLACIDELVSSGIGGLALMPEQHPSISEKLLELKKRGIPVVTVNTDIDKSDRLAYVGSNNQKEGQTAAGLMNLIVGGSAHVGAIIGSTDVLCHTERIKGFCEQAEKYYSGLQIVDIVENHDDDYESFERTKELLERNPEIDALFLAAAGVSGTCRAVQDKGLAGKINIICFDLNNTTQTMLESRVVQAVIEQQPMKQAAKALAILFEYLGMGNLPKCECCYTDNLIKIFESL